MYIKNGSWILVVVLVDVNPLNLYLKSTIMNTLMIIIAFIRKMLQSLFCSFIVFWLSHHAMQLNFSTLHSYCSADSITSRQVCGVLCSLTMLIWCLRSLHRCEVFLFFCIQFCILFHWGWRCQVSPQCLCLHLVSHCTLFR